MWVALFVLGIVAGVASGMFGIGGGTIIVPVLIFLGMTQTEANGTSLAALLLPVGIFAVLSYSRNGLLIWRVSLIIALGLLAGGYLGAELAQAMNPTLLLGLYGVFLLYTGWRMADPIRWFRQGTQSPEDAQDLKEPNTNLLAITAVGLAAGVASGLFGIGGGAIIVPLLVLLLDFGQKSAVGTSLGALLLPVGLGGALSYYQSGNLELAAAVPLALGLLAGAFFGAQITISLPAATVKKMYGVFLIVIGIRFLLGSLLG